MSARINRASLVVALIVVGLMPAIASAQQVSQASPLHRALLLAGPAQVGRGAATVRRDEDVARRAPASKKSAMGWAIALGIAGGIGVSAIAASKYGDNETGQFCTRCFMQWSAVSIPVGAGIGAGVGFLIDRARR